MTAALLTFAGFVYLNNASFLGGPITDRPVLLAHRGVGQEYDFSGVVWTDQTCPASHMRQPKHKFLENTIPAMSAAFAYGANIIEFDVHRTVDNRFAVFHDWTLECRTNGTGRTRDHSLAMLQALDVGYGYTADGGKMWPFRGRGVGLMPSLADVLAQFPERSFLVNIKRNTAEDGDMLGKRLAELQADHEGEIMVSGGSRAVEALLERLPRTRAVTRSRLFQCVRRYIVVGWSGYIPSTCERSVLLIPVNLAPWLWGWPNRFLQRMEAAGAVVFLVGEYWGKGPTRAFDDVDRLAEISSDYSGGIWTNRIERIGPAVRHGGHFGQSASP